MLGASLIVVALLGQPAEPSRDAAALLEKLGSASTAEREATRGLENLGARALPALRSALKSRDAEIRTRARALIRKIEGNLLIQGTSIRLDFQDAPLDEIVQSLGKQAGFGVRLGQIGPDAGSRRLTLREAQPVPFWQAIDRLCQAGSLTAHTQIVGQPGQGAPQPSLVLSEDHDPISPPNDHHGPIRFRVTSLSYQSRITFQAGSAMTSPMRPSARGPAPAAGNPATRPAEGPLPGGAPAPGGVEKSGMEPARFVQFHVQMAIDPEPRMTLSEVGNLRVVEAVDDRGHSLLPAQSGEERPLGAPHMLNPPVMAGMAGPTAHLNIALYRPEAAGQLIKTLRGTVEVTASVLRSNPLVIPLEGAAGKTFENDDRRVVVHSISADPRRRQEVIELTIDNLEDLLGGDAVNDQGVASGRAPLMFRSMGPRFGNDPARWPIQIVTATGQNIYYQTSVDRDSGRVTLKVARIGQQAQAQEIRIAGVVRARAKIPFEFHELPMP